MIGQRKLLKWLDNNVDVFPHFIVLVGPRGSGKRLFSKMIANKLSLVYNECEIKVDSVREVISTANTVQTKVMYCFADADNMTSAAKNAMLKITEEPPKDAYFCLTVTDDSSLLDTIKSRAYVLKMNEYTQADLKEYYYSTIGSESVSSEEVDLFARICTVPGDVDKLTEYGKDFYDFVELVVDNISEVEPANAFKSSNKLALKSDEGYDLTLFWNCFITICVDRMDSDSIEERIKYGKGVVATTPFLNKATKMGVNKEQLYDRWVFEIREAWYVE